MTGMVQRSNGSNMALSRENVVQGARPTWTPEELLDYAFDHQIVAVNRDWSLTCECGVTVNGSRDWLAHLMATTEAALGRGTR